MGNETSEVLVAMLKENTGRHFLDSGGAYGRAWERNQTRDFANEPSSRLKFSRCGSKKQFSEMEVTHSTYHFLLENLTFSQEWQTKFDALAEAEGNDHKSWLVLMEEFMDSVEGDHPFGGRGSMTVNTYNHESMLDQTLQYSAKRIEDTDEILVLLQIHGGCDVRGGYTAPKAFIVSGEEYAFFDDARFGVYCSECDEGRWYSDGGSHTCNDYGHKPVEEYPVVPHGEETDLGPATITLTAPAKGMIYVDDNGVAYCPCCAKGTLDACNY